VPPAGAFASPRVVAGELVHRGGATFVWAVSWSETETTRVNEQVVGGEAEVLVRGGDLSCEAETPRARR
jgi:hypothetical protein